MKQKSAFTASSYCFAARVAHKFSEVMLRMVSLHRRNLNGFVKTVCGAFLLAACLSMAVSANAASNIVLDSAPVTWNIIGLDSNNPTTEGPDEYPVGIRVKNTGTTASTTVTAQMALTGLHPYVNISDNAVITTTTIAPGECFDFFFNVKIVRTSAAYDTTQGYSITISGGGLVTPLVRNETLTIKKLVEQQSNDILSLVGPSVVTEGETRQFILDSTTQTGGRAQVQTSVNFPNSIFQILDVQSTFSNPGLTIDKFYADACGWNRTTLACGAPGVPTLGGGQVGASIHTVFTVYIKQTPTTAIYLVPSIIDTSNASNFHYNTDYGLNIISLKPHVDLSVVKTAVDNPVEAGSSATYMITAMNLNPSTAATDVKVTDTLPLGMTFVSSVPPPTSGPNPLLWNLGSLSPSTSQTITVVTQSSCATTGPLTNIAGVSSTSRDTNQSNNISSQTVTVQDTTPPVITCPGNLVVNSSPGQCAGVSVPFNVTATDGCGPVTVTSVPPSGSTFPLGVTNVIAKAKDASGNESTCSFTVTVVDAQAPQLTCPPAIDINAAPSMCSVADAGVTTPTATDNCTTVGVTGSRNDSLSLSDPYPVGVTTIIWTATDSANLVTTCSQTVTVHDMTDPIINCPSNIIVDATPGKCQADSVTFNVTATDNCTTVSVVTVPASGTAFPVGTTLVLATATDSEGNDATCQFSVTVNDTELPTLTCPATINVTADIVGCQATSVTIVPPVGSDNCSATTVTGTRSDSLALSAPYPIGTTTITWVVSDGAGNMNQCVQQVNVQDTTNPTIICPPTIDVDADPLNCSAANVVTSAPLTSDNCSTQGLVAVRSDLLLLSDPYPVGDTTIVWTISDNSGNMTSCTQLVTVHDVTAPAITCPATIAVDADALDCSADVTVTEPSIVSDNCSTYTLIGVRVDSLPLTDPYPVGDTTIIWTATDSSSNSTSCTQTVTVTDNTKPTITCGATINVTADEIGCQAGNVTIVPPATSDNCGVSTVTGVRSDSLPLTDPYPVGSTTIVWTVEDIHGNTETCTQLVVVADTTNPTIVCPIAVVIDADPLACEAANVVTSAPLTSDNCSTSTLDATRSDSLTLSDPYPVGDTTIIWTVSDSSGNMTSCTQLVTVQDVTAPAITCPAGVSADTDENCSADLTITEPTIVSDNCSTYTVVGVRGDSLNLNEPYPKGVTTIIWTATDAANNASSCTQTVTVNDTVPPTITCGATVNVTADPIGCQATNVTVTPPSASDNCGTVTLAGVRSDSLPLTDPYPVGTTTITWTATDGSSVTATCLQQVIVSDTTNPTITCPATIDVDADAQSCEATNVTTTQPLTSDNCSTSALVALRSDSMLLTDPYPVGNTNIIWTVTDGSGNMTSCTQLVTVHDITPPALTCLNEINVSATSAQCGAVVDFVTTATDSCGSTITVVANPPSGSLFPIGTTTVSVTATDSEGNMSDCSFDVVVADNTDPIISCPADILTCTQQIDDLGTYTVTDCSATSVVIVRSDNLLLTDDYPVGPTTITYTVTDEYGNMGMCQQSIQVADQALPMVGCPDNLTTNAATGLCVSAPITYPPINAMDNCSTDTSGLTITYDPPNGSTFPIGSTVVTVTIVDEDQNQDSCTFLVNVLDAEAPVINCPENLTLDNTPGQCGANNVTFTLPSAQDCSSSVTVVATPPSGSNFPSGTTTVNVTATDDAGNVGRCSFTVTVNDTENPTITCPATVDVDADANCQATNVQIGTPQVSDNCSSPTVNGVRGDFMPLSNPYPIGTTIITWTVTDGSQNITSCTQQVVVTDTSLPTIACPVDLDLTLAEGLCVSSPVQYGAPVVSDNCTSDPLNITVTYDPPAGSQFPVGETTVTVTAEDEAGNKAECTFKVTVTDTTPPVVTCPSDIIIENTPGQCGANNVTFTLPSAQDCSSSVTVVATPPSGSNFPSGTTTVNVTATDDAGNVGRCSFTVTVNDTEDPTITCPATVDVNADANCQATNVLIGTPQVSDNCSSPSVSGVRSDSQLLSDPYPIGTTIITWTVTDGSQNLTSCTQQVNVTDVSMPTIACPADMNLSLAEGLCVTSPVQYGAPVVSDNCTSDPLNITVTYDPPAGTQFPVGETTVTVTAEDEAGNKAECTFLVNVLDAEAPVINCPENLTVDNTPGQCGANNVTFTLPSAQDCSSSVTVVATPPSGSNFPSGTTTVNVTATDDSGNVGRCSFTVTVNDTENPTITCPATVNVDADANCQATNVNIITPEVSDNCGSPSVSGVRSDSLPLSDPYPIGTTIITWTVTDGSQNVASCQQQVVVTDTSMPTIACPADMNLSLAEGLCVTAPVQYGSPVVSDNCTSVPADITVTYNPPSGSTFPVGESTVTVTAEDLAGNKAECTFKVIVADTNPPVITCPSNITVNNTPGQCGANNVTFTLPSAQDCSSSVTVVADPPSGSNFPSGTTTVNVTATDDSGNVGRCSFTVTVNDTENPTITCPATVNVDADANCQATNVNIITPEVSDNCSNPTVSGVRSDSLPLTDPYPIGTTIITWTVTDGGQNVASCQQQVVVTDSSMPTIACPADITVNVAGGECLSAPVQYLSPVVSDNCSTAPVDIAVVYNPPSGTQFTVGENIVTVTATDLAGNMAQCTFKVIVNDVTPPVIACPGNITVDSMPGMCGAPSVIFNVTATDNCSNPVTVSTIPASGSAFPVGETLVTASATDASGNNATCSFTVTVNDGEAPSLTCPVPMVVESSPGECQALNVTYEASATDNCGGTAVVEFDPPSGSNFPIGVSVVQVKATDSKGNVANCSFSVTVEDKEAPRIACPDTMVVATVPCELTAIVNLVPPQTLDQCGEVVISGTRSDDLPLSDPYPAGDTIVTWTATDSNGNSSICTQVVRVDISECLPICDGPDLVVRPVIGPNAVCKGKVCKVDGYYCVTNIGTQPSGETSICFYLSVDEFVDASDCQFKFDKKHHKIPALQPGEGHVMQLKGKVPACVDLDKLFILALVDCPNVVDECREDNNVTADHPSVTDKNKKKKVKTKKVKKSKKSKKSKD